MRACEGCQKEVTTVKFNADDPRALCSACYQAPPARYNASLRHSWEDGSGSISVGHLQDIKSRRVAPDGSVYRDVGRKYI